MNFIIKSYCIETFINNKEESIKRLLQEIIAHQLLYRCPGGIVRMHEVFEDAHFIYLILDWHQGVSLHEVKGPLKEESAFTILEQVLLTLDYMHKRGIIHCQISLESILINNINNETEDTEISICSLGNVHV
jgi:serine/threonine protein kinase